MITLDPWEHDLKAAIDNLSDDVRADRRSSNFKVVSHPTRPPTIVPVMPALAAIIWLIVASVTDYLLAVGAIE